MGKRFKKEMVETRVLAGVQCDRCKEDIPEVYTEQFEYAVFTAEWGYPSKFDGEKWIYLLCEECAEETMEWIENGITEEAN